MMKQGKSTRLSRMYLLGCAIGGYALLNTSLMLGKKLMLGRFELAG